MTTDRSDSRRTLTLLPWVARFGSAATFRDMGLLLIALAVWRR